ncbi:MAG: hypothetical protein E2579_25945 [Pseudomonas sp.]|uniref:hypothetical protein n=1 Tax=Ectopseudomonas guguanensis TaxID=1198456 RepID=UPI0012D4D0D7|nr:MULTISPECIES: hypothetical protein [Pseudomonas]MPT21138.1 hypothetical protein [Pseudomonas sp.]WJH56523.1 hypothetical protein FE254_10190 [Pseudomonas guguanensis]
MMFTVLRSLRWLLSLGKKIVRVAFGPTLLIVFLTLVSQVAALLAAFLPLKVVILLGSEGIPSYLPPDLAALGRDSLIGLLCLGTLGVFLLHLLAERVIGVATVSGAGRLLQRSHKMALFENQDDQARDAYLRFSRIVAAAVFVSLSLLLLTSFYPAMAVVQLVYLALVALVFIGVAHFHTGLEQRLANAPVKLTALLNFLSGLGFFVVFGFLVVDFLLFSHPSVMLGIVALLLGRQVLQKASIIVADTSVLFRQRAKLDALFFHGKVLMPVMTDEQNSLWSLMKPERRVEWVKPLLQAYTGYTDGPFICSWQETTVFNATSLQVKAGDDFYLFKLFAVNRNAAAIHESTLMLESLSELPALRLLGVTNVGALQCLIYEHPAKVGIEIQKPIPIVAELNARLMAIRPSESLQMLYRRSHPMLWQRLDLQVLANLEMAVDSSDDQDLFAQLLAAHPRIISTLQELPLYIHVPDIRGADLYWHPDGKAYFLNWTRWALEPLGAGWLVLEYWFNELAAVFERAKAASPELSQYPLEQVELAALCFALDQHCQRRQYRQALALTPQILERLEALESRSAKKKLKLEHG